MVATLIVSLVAVAIASLLLYIKYKQTYWARMKMPYIPPEFPYGNLKGIGRVRNMAMSLKVLYDRVKGSATFCGIYFVTSPVVLALDIEFVQDVLIKDFNSFSERGLYNNKHDDPLSSHLVSQDTDDWRKLRSQLTPTFTSGKMKFMYETVVDVGDRFQKVLATHVEKDPVLNTKELVARFSTDVIGSCAFGIECNSLTDPNAPFRLMSRKPFEDPRRSDLSWLFLNQFPRIGRALGIKTTREDVDSFFRGIVHETISLREKEGIKRNDFMDLLIEIKNTGMMDGKKVGKITVDELAAQAYLFFLAGFETSSTTMSYALHEMAFNTSIQEKAREEIDNTIKRHGGKLTYEATNEMPYLDCIIYEALRKYPPLPIMRRAVKPYYVAKANFTLEKGTTVMIPAYAIHHDPEYYPDPETFDPERFTPEGIASRPKQTFLSFGDGQRNCVAKRFGMMETRVGLVTILRNFYFEPCAETQKELTFSNTGLVLNTNHKMFLSFKKRELC